MSDIAGVTHDIVLDGAGYMLATVKGAGTNYIKETIGREGIAATLSTDGTERLDSGNATTAPVPFRRLYWDEWRGAGRNFLRGGGAGKTNGVLSGARSRAIDGSGETGGFGGLLAEMVNLRPLLNGQGCGIAPAGLKETMGNAATQFAAIEFGDNLYIIQDNIIRQATVDTNGNLTGLTAVATLPANVISVGYTPDGYAWACTGPNAYRVDNISITQGFTISYITAYQGVRFSATSSIVNYTVGGSTFALLLGSNITALCAHQGALWIGTLDGLYRLEGRLDMTTTSSYDQFKYRLVKIVGGSPGASADGNLRNWRGLLSFDDALWGCLNGHLVRVDSSNGKVERQLVPSGWVYSLTEAAGMLVAVLQIDGASQIWCFEPTTNGWWRLGGVSNITYVFSGGGVVKNGQLIGLHESEASLTHWPFDSTNPAGVNQTNFGQSWPANNNGYLTLPLIASDDLAREAGLSGGKLGLVGLMRVGIEWDCFDGMDSWQGWPDLAALTDLSFRAEISLDEGQTWTALSNAMGSNSHAPASIHHFNGRTDWLLDYTQNLLQPVSQIGQGAPYENDRNFNGWLIRFKIAGAYTPLIRRVWLDYKVVEFSYSLGLRWKLILEISDQPEAIGLDGQPATADYVNLWIAWLLGDTTTFYDLNGDGPYKVKVVSLRQERLAPGYQPTQTLPASWLFHVELVAVSE